MTDVQILINAMKAQLEKPTRAVVNGESSFVRQRLSDAGQHDLAKQYWYWICSAWQAHPIFGDEVLALQHQLDAIDKQSTMPSWGTYGT